jgi:ribonuclease BN (tRNA processing enzyme)
MKITVLGQWGAYPKAGEATAGYLLEHNNEKILMDCGSGVLAQLQKYIKLSELSAVIITHTHFDHIADLGCLQYACLIETDIGLRVSALPIYIADESNNNKFKTMKGTDLRSISEKDTLYISGLQLSFFKTFHEAYCLAVKVQFQDKVFVYTADTFYDESLVDFCASVELLIAEASFYKDFADAKMYGHMNSSDVGSLALKANVGKVILTHLPHFGELDRLALEAGEIYQGPIELASNGMEIIVD